MKKMNWNHIVGLLALMMGLIMAYWDITAFLRGGGALATNWIYYLLGGLYLLFRHQLLHHISYGWLVIGLSLGLLVLLVVLSDIGVIPYLEFSSGFVAIFCGLIAMDLDTLEKVGKGDSHAKN
ncbi:hypothetical protein [Streptococcus porci]|uniref:hypothetical protein n=1 Tax=Streptococcus porci TaxID=502567 RepID=UPI0003F4CEC9|nr:hypothetical protein [Streptococcus porci]